MVKKIIFFAFLFFIIFFSLSSSGGESGSVSISASLDRDKIPKNQLAQLTVSLKWKGDFDKFSFSDPPKPILDKVKIIGTSASNIRGIENNISYSERRYVYTLKPEEEGIGTIEPISVEFTDQENGSRHTLSTPAITLEITSPYIPFIKKLFGSAIFRVSVFIIFVGTAAGIGLVLIKKSHIKKEKEAKEEVLVLSAEENALKELDSLSQLRLIGDHKQYYSRISQILRDYLSNVYQIRTKEVISTDILRELEGRAVEPSILDAVEGIFKTCDMVKFAGSAPSTQEMDQILNRLKTFLQSQKKNEKIKEMKS